MDAGYPFDFEHEGTTIAFGSGRASRLGEEFDRRGWERALIVCGRTVGSTPAVMDPVRDGLGDRLVGVFDETTPAKRIESVYDGIAAMRDADADVLVGLGGGSSLDVAKLMRVMAADGRSLDDVHAELAERGRIEPPAPAGSTIPTVAIPTTLAGADLSAGGGVEVAGYDEPPVGEITRVNAAGDVAPELLVYDPALFATTPDAVLAGSAVNGFNKGIETIYARDKSPISDATAARGLALLQDLPAWIDGRDRDALDRAVVGIIMVQFERTTGLLHAFGHGLSRRYDVQQGVVHAVVTPPALRFVFDRVDGRRALLADALGVDAAGADDQAAGVIEAVTALRDALDLPDRLRDVEGLEREHLAEVAAYVVDDPAASRGPAGLDVTPEDVEAVLREAW